jgi:hypothetical protein
MNQNSRVTGCQSKPTVLGIADTRSNYLPPGSVYLKVKSPRREPPEKKPPVEDPPTKERMKAKAAWISKK